MLVPNVITLLAICAGAGLFGWRSLPDDHPRRRLWQAGSVVCVIAIAAFIPWNATRLHQTFDSANPKKQSLSAQLKVENDLIALTKRRAITLRCGLVGVPYHTPIPLLALELHASPAKIVTREIANGTFLAAASKAVREVYLLDPNDPGKNYAVPPHFKLTASNRSWLVYKRCG